MCRRYVTVDEDAGRALFYALAESQRAPESDPLVLWLNGVRLDPSSFVGPEYNPQITSHLTTSQISPSMGIPLCSGAYRVQGLIHALHVNYVTFAHCATKREYRTHPYGTFEDWPQALPSHDAKPSLFQGCIEGIIVRV